MRIIVAEARSLNLLPTVKARGKYNNKRTFYNGKWYMSALEAKRAQELDLLMKGKVITRWEAQPKYPFTHNEVFIGTYIADFKVWYPDGHVEVEDVKGVETDIFKWKKKMLLAYYGINLKLIYGSTKTKNNFKNEKHGLRRSV